MAVLDIKGVRIGTGRTKTIVSLMEPDQEGLLATAARAVAAGADCLEWRADFFGALDDDVAVVATGRTLMDALPRTPLIFTLRSREQGGNVDVTPERATVLLGAVIATQAADLVDIELGLGDALVTDLAQLAHGNGVRAIVSYHDFAAMPPVEEMADCLVHMAELGADIPKLAAMSRSNQETHDLMRATSLARERVNTPLLTMAMGAMGTNSRLSGEAFGSALTFCALGKASAPGQVELAQALPVLEAIHRQVAGDEEEPPAQEATLTHGAPAQEAAGQTPATTQRATTAAAAAEISGHTHLISLIGNPTTHSLSPATHNLSFAQLGIDTRYLCFDVDANAQLPGILDAMRAMRGWDGSNVTMPFKQAVIPLLDEMDEAAELIGAVNVIRKRDGRLRGYNTDGMGFMRNLRAHGVASEGARMVLLGCGGAGSAVLVQAALDGAERIDVFCRPGLTSWKNVERLQERLAGHTSCEVVRCDLFDTSLLAERIAQATVLVNATSVGMGEGCTDSLVPPALIRPGMPVADVIYHPRTTQLLVDAQALGCPTIGGLGMMLEQAAAGEAIWYGVEMDTQLVAERVFS